MAGYSTHARDTLKVFSSMLKVARLCSAWCCPELPVYLANPANPTRRELKGGVAAVSAEYCTTAYTSD
jgi:hypothetical protein